MLIETVLGPIDDAFLLLVETVEETEDTRVSKRAWLYAGKEVRSDVDIVIKRGQVLAAVAGGLGG